MTDGTASFEQFLSFIAETDVYSHWVDMAPLLYHVGKMMHIDDSLTTALAPELLQEMLQKRFSVHFHQGLGHAVGKGLETCAQPRCKYHRFHRAGNIFEICCSRWHT